MSTYWRQENVRHKHLTERHFLKGSEIEGKATFKGARFLLYLCEIELLQIPRRFPSTIHEVWFPTDILFRYYCYLNFAKNILLRLAMA